MDDRLRDLERRAAEGDEEAQRELEQARRRADLPEAVETVERELAEQLSRLQGLERDFYGEGFTHLQRYLAAVFRENEGLNTVLLRGYTPGFCDGELCEHSTEILVRDEYGEAPELRDNELPASKANKLVSQLRPYCELLEATYGTDWQLVCRPAGDHVELDHEPYECEY